MESVDRILAIYFSVPSAPLRYENVDPGLHLISVPERVSSNGAPFNKCTKQAGRRAGELTLPHKQIADLNVKKPLSCVSWTWLWEGAAVGQMVAGIDGRDSESLRRSALLQSRGVGLVFEQTELVFHDLRLCTRVGVFMRAFCSHFWRYGTMTCTDPSPRRSLLSIAALCFGSSHIPHIPQRGGSTTCLQAVCLSVFKGDQ